MKFSTKSTYGLRAMIRLAENWKKESLSLSVIAKSENISQKYLERIFARLKTAKLIESEKGAGGGYKLSRSPSKINILEIIDALEGKFAPFHCYTKSGKVVCSTSCNCGVTLVLNRIQTGIEDSLRNMSLNQLK